MSEWLSGFLMNPALAAGTAAVASPILIHIFSKRRYRRIRWAAMDFLLQAQRKNRRRIKIEQIILLALRCLAVFLIALMIARPFVRTSAVAGLLGAASRTDRIILLDDSFSMGYRLAGGATVFSQAAGAARQIGKWAASESPADTLTLLTTSHPRQPVVALPSLSDENARRLGDHLDMLNVSQTAAHFPDAAAAIAELVRKSPTNANVAIYMISDFQRHDWLTPTASREVSPAVAPLSEISGRQVPVKLVLVDVSAEAPKNVAITDLSAMQPQIVAGVPARFEVSLANFSPAPLEQVELTVSLSEHTLPAIVIPKIQSGQVVREPFEVTFPQEGADFLRIALSGTAAGSDALALDNSRAVAVEVSPAVNVLLVDGKPGTDPFRDEVHLLKTALRPAGRTASGNDVTVITEQELDAVELSHYHLVVLANVARLSLASQAGLEKFVQAGGGLAVFAGDLLDAAYYNRELYIEGRGLLPVRIGETVQAPLNGQPFHISDWDANHPLLRSFAGPLATVLRQVRVGAFVSTEEAPAGESANPGGAGTAPATMPAPPLVLARYDDAKQSPAIVLRTFGRGSVVLITTSADQAWNDWGANFSYVPFSLELVAYAARASDAPAQCVVGSPLTVPVESGAFKPAARLRTPNYPVDPEIPVAASSDPGAAGTRFEYRDTTQSGVWTLELTTSSGQVLRRFAAVNPSADESNLAHASKAELEAALAGVKFDYVRDLSVFTRESAAARQELWWPILLAAVLILMTEHGLAWYFGTRG